MVPHLLSGILLSGPALLALQVADLRQAGILVICMILAIGVHEFSHAFVATRLGDPTAEAEGRLTLNPINHMDPIGTLALPLILSLGVAGGLFFGWGRPVPFQARFFTRKITMRAGAALVAFAGPLSNLLLAILTLGIIFAANAAGLVDAASLAGSGSVTHPLLVFFFLNLVLFAFNLLPIHPLDGGKVLALLLGAKYQHIDDFLARRGFIILVVLVVALPGVLATLLGPFMDLGQWALRAVLA